MRQGRFSAFWLIPETMKEGGLRPSLFGNTLRGLAIIKSRLCRLAAAKVGVPVGHGYNYFLACDTAERIIFTVVAGSGSEKLCWHSRGNDNDQENAGYVRESAGGSEQA